MSTTTTSLFNRHDIVNCQTFISGDDQIHKHLPVRWSSSTTSMKNAIACLRTLLLLILFVVFGMFFFFRIQQNKTKITKKISPFLSSVSIWRISYTIVFMAVGICGRRIKFNYDGIIIRDNKKRKKRFWIVGWYRGSNRQNNFMFIQFYCTVQCAYWPSSLAKMGERCW